MENYDTSKESEPLLKNAREADGVVITRQRKWKVPVGVGVGLAAVVVVAVVGVSVYRKPASRSADRENVLSAQQDGLNAHLARPSAQQSNLGALQELACRDKEPFQGLTQDEIQALIIPRSLFPADIVEPLTDDERAWLLTERPVVAKHRRKEVRTMTTEEWNTYARAVGKMKESYPTSGGRSAYDILVAVHAPPISPYAHFGPSLLPWHRVYLDTFEAILTEHEPSVSVPYWDTVLDEPLPTPRDSVLWLDQLFGPNNGDVLSGPFAGHTNPAGYCTGIFSEILQRGVREKAHRLTSYLSNDMINYSVFNYTSFSEFQKPVTLNATEDASSLLEMYHNAVHAFIGGAMANVPCAPVDPIFWLWHASLDCIWEEFRTESQRTNLETDYPIIPNIDPGYAPYAPMEPFPNLQNIWGLSNHFTAERYECAQRPTKYSCVLDDDCGSSMGYLFCDACGQCVSKVVHGGDCTDLEDKACFCDTDNLLSAPKCLNNKCVCE